MKSLLDSAEMNLLHWSGEPQVSEDISRLLLRIFSEKKRYNSQAIVLTDVYTVSNARVYVQNMDAFSGDV